MDPAMEPAWANALGLLCELERTDEAWEVLQRARFHHPESALIKRAAVRVLRDMGMVEASWQLASGLPVDTPADGVMRGLICEDRCEWQAAELSYRDTLVRWPGHPEARFRLCLLGFAVGKFTPENWLNFAARRETTEWRAHTMRPHTCWRPGKETTAANRLVVLGEQGIGDEIMYSRWMPQIIQDFQGPVTLACSPRLLPVMRAAGWDAHIISRDTAEVAELIRLESCAGVYLADIPSGYVDNLNSFDTMPWLRTPEREAEIWRQRLGLLSRPRVGLVWRGGLNKTRRRQRSLEWREVESLLQAGNRSIQWISLQHDLTVPEQVELRRMGVHVWADSGEPASQAGLLPQLDLVISVCSSVVSLAASLGVASWVLVPRNPGWMFGRRGDSTPWLPKAQLFRQECAAGWAEVLSEIRAALSVWRYT
jgi:hypothetical protein